MKITAEMWKEKVKEERLKLQHKQIQQLLDEGRIYYHKYCNIQLVPVEKAAIKKTITGLVELYKTADKKPVIITYKRLNEFIDLHTKTISKHIIMLTPLFFKHKTTFHGDTKRHSRKIITNSTFDLLVQELDKRNEDKQNDMEM